MKHAEQIGYMMNPKREMVGSAMKSLTASALVAALLIAGIPAVGAVNPVPGGESQTLGQGDTWKIGAAVTYTAVGDTGLKVSFAAGPQPPAMALLKGTVLVDDGIANSPFSGNYIERAINSLQFAITSTGYQPGTAMLVLKAQSLRTWSYDFRGQVSAVAGARTGVLVPLTAAGWAPDKPIANKDAAFSEDLQAMVSVAIVLAPTYAGAISYPAQAYTIEDCVLVNDDGISSAPGNLTGLEKALIARFGYGYGSVDRLTEAMKKWDADGDGMFDFMEIWSENDPAYADSIFEATKIEVLDGGVEVTWTCVKGESYTVLRSSSLGGTFSPVPGLTGLVATGTGYMTAVDESANGGAGPYYYRMHRIVIE